MPYNWNIQYPPVRRSKVIPRDIAVPLKKGKRPSRAQWEAHKQHVLDAVAYNEALEQRLHRMEQLGERIGTAIKLVIHLTIIWPLQFAIFAVRNIHQIMVFLVFSFFLSAILVIADLHSRIP